MQVTTILAAAMVCVPLFAQSVNGVSVILSVPESALATTDITTADVSTSKHGYAPKSPNDATKFLDGTGAYSRPGFVIPFVANTAGLPANSTTYYLGLGIAANWSSFATEGSGRIYIPRAGTITAAYVAFNNLATVASGETSTVSIRLNNTTDTTISSSVVNNATNTAFSNTALAIAVVAGDYFEIKWVTPAWGTPPTGAIKMSGTIYVQ